jgi:hypothetical protein
MADSALPSLWATNMPMKLCEASLNREKRNCPSNLVAVGIKVGEGSGVMVGSLTGGASIVGTGVAVGEIGVGTTCGAQAVTMSTPTTMNNWNERMVNILILLSL